MAPALPPIMKLTEPMGNVWKHQSHRTPDRLLAIGDDALDRDVERLQNLLDFLEQSRDLPRSTAEQRTRSPDFFRQAVTHHPKHLVAHVGLSAIQSQNHVTLLLQEGRDPLSVGAV
jgi:hypothetical protein